MLVPLQRGQCGGERYRFECAHFEGLCERILGTAVMRGRRFEWGHPGIPSNFPSWLGPGSCLILAPQVSGPSSAAASPTLPAPPTSGAQGH